MFHGPSGRGSSEKEDPGARGRRVPESRGEWVQGRGARWAYRGHALESQYNYLKLASGNKIHKIDL